VSDDQLLRGDRVEYIGEALPDVGIDTGTIGFVTRVESGSVFAVWPKARPPVQAVPLESVRLLGPEVARAVTQAPNARMWDLLGEELGPLKTGRPRDPYMDQGCHPDIVSRVWNELGKTLPCDCRGQAKGKPVLAHPDTDRIFALAHGTQYALWLTPEDFSEASEAGAKTLMVWSGGSTTELAESAGPGWIWGRWYPHEPQWLHDAYLLSGLRTS
jgi:hypothetical protein